MNDQATQQSGPRSRERRATIDDVAKLAGVHRSTVSRALSRPDLIGADTRARVQDAITRLGYRPNRVARSLSVGQTGLLAVLVPDSASPYFAEFVRSAQECAAVHDVSVIVAGTGRFVEAEADLVGSLVGSVDGTIVVSAKSSTPELRRLAGGRPLVSVGDDGDSGLDIVLPDHEIARLALDHLWSLGHRRIAVIEGPANFSSTLLRRSGTHHWAEQHEGARLHTLEMSGEGIGHGFAAADEVVALLDDGFTAVSTFSDMIAVGLFLRLLAMGVSVPGDLSLVGTDDVELASFVPGGLTTVALGVRELGRAAVEAVLGITPVSRADLPSPKMVVRGSTAPPRR